jgi:allantoin racemase
MPRLLLINPNTTLSVTRSLAQVAEFLAPAAGRVTARTARFGAAYISSEVGVVLAAHAALDAYAIDAAEAREVPDAILIGCFGDPGLAALAELAPCPVVGLAEAAMRSAVLRGRFAIVTGGAAWAPMLRRLAFSIGLQPALADIVTVQATGAELAADPARARGLLLGACRTVLARAPDVASIVVGGAALAGVAADLQPEVDVPLLDSVRSGVQAAWDAAVALPREVSALPSLRPSFDGPPPWTAPPSDARALTGLLNDRRIP